MIGKTISHFEIIEKLGQGGMGEVFLARDTFLDRKVAIKLLPDEFASDSERLARFAREAKLLASLTHPNIAAIHGLEQAEGRRLIVMELAEGETLEQKIRRAPLPVKEALEICRQIAEGLEAAQEKGIVHRDLKPSNVMVSADGKVKILDFGLAKALETTPAGDLGETPTREDGTTRHGIILGTAPYMSPEQASGKPLDARTDIWAFGCVLYETLARKRAFPGDTTTEVLAKILERDPDWSQLPGAVPENVRCLLRRCLQKDRHSRLRSIGDARIELEDTLAGRIREAAAAQEAPRRLRMAAVVLAAVALGIIAAVLWVVTSGPAFREAGDPGGAQSPPVRSIAVLPLENLSGDPEQEYFVDGMTDAITTELGKISGFERVISWQSMKQYKHTARPADQIAAELHVDALVHGVVLRQGSKVRVSPKLIRARPERQLWAGSYDRDVSEILSLHSEVAQAIAREVRITLTTREARASAARPTVNPEAYEYYLRGNRYLEQRDDEQPLRSAARMFEQSVALDPSFAAAYAKLSFTYAYLYFSYFDRTEERLNLARELAETALRLEPDAPEAHWALGNLYYRGYRDYDRALEQLALAEEISPNDSEIPMGIGSVKRRQGKFAEAAIAMERAASLNPNNPSHAFTLGATHALLRRYPEAQTWIGRALSLAPSGFWYARKAKFALLQGDIETARAALAECTAKTGTHQLVPYYGALVELFTHNYAGALSVLSSDSWDTYEHQFLFVPRSLVQAEVLALMGQPASAARHFDSARKALEEKIRVDPRDDRFHGSLGIAYAGLGLKQRAIEEGRKGVELMPAGTDAWRAAYRLEEMARIHVMVGEYGEALKQFDALLSVPAEVSVWQLSKDPTLAPLRKHPGFQDLVRKYSR